MENPKKSNNNDDDDASINPYWVHSLCTLDSVRRAFHVVFPRALWEGTTKSKWGTQRLMTCLRLQNCWCSRITSHASGSWAMYRTQTHAIGAPAATSTSPPLLAPIDLLDHAVLPQQTPHQSTFSVAGWSSLSHLVRTHQHWNWNETLKYSWRNVFAFVRSWLYL